MLHTLLIDDDETALDQVSKEIEAFSKERNEPIQIHHMSSFDDAIGLLDDGSRRFDVVVTDTYAGPPGRVTDHADALKVVEKVRKVAYTPMIVYSSASMPGGFNESTFVKWVDKAEPNGIVDALGRILDTGIPQLASALHQEVEQVGASFVWEFLEDNWERLEGNSRETFERIMRKRLGVAITFGAGDGGVSELSEVESAEFFHYPSISVDRYSLGEIIRSRGSVNDWKVILTPHCHLAVQPNAEEPRANMVLTLKVIPRADFEEVEKGWERVRDEEKFDKLRKYISVPSRKEVGLPSGRYWFIPGFLDIPPSFVDFMAVDSIALEDIRDGYESVAVISQPFAESLQAAFTGFYSSVGTPNLKLQTLV